MYAHCTMLKCHVGGRFDCHIILMPYYYMTVDVCGQNKNPGVHFKK